MSPTDLSPSQTLVERILNVRSIRAKLILAFGILLALGTINIGVYYWGAAQRISGYEQLKRAIDRQVLILDVRHLLQDQIKLVNLMAMENVVPDGALPTQEEYINYTRLMDTISVRLEAIEVRSDPERRAAVAALHEKTKQLADAWRTFFRNQGPDPALAAEALYTRALPLADELLTTDLPTSVRLEENLLHSVEQNFETTEQRFSRTVWLSFVLSAFLGVFLALFIGHDLHRSIMALKEGADRFGAGDLDYRVRISNHDELGEVAASFNEMAHCLHDRSREIAQKNEENERLLLNILPEAIAVRLKQGEETIADDFSEVTVLFSDLVNFTSFASRTKASKLVFLLNDLFSAFDEIALDLGVEKIKTIGDAYMAVAGLPVHRTDHAQVMAKMALQMQEALNRFNATHGTAFEARIGLNSGPVVAGVIGRHKFVYDLWGDAVNVAARMESHGLPGRIQVSANTCHILSSHYSFEPRGEIDVKGKGMMETFLLEQERERSNPASAGLRKGQPG